MDITIPYPGASRTYTVEIDTKVLNQMKAVEEWRGFMLALGRLGNLALPDGRETVWKEALASVELEGATLQMERVQAMIDDDTPPANRSEQEFCNYFQLLQQLDDFKGQPGRRKEALRESDLRAFHGRIVAGTLGNAGDAGRYRQHDVHIGGAGGDGVI